ncbi:MAG: GNAT family protein [Dehalococcoidia bacterium]
MLRFSHAAMQYDAGDERAGQGVDPSQNPMVQLTPVTRDDIARVARWLEDPEIAEMWFGRYTYGAPAHLGYEPKKMLEKSDEELRDIFSHSHHESSRLFFSVLTMEGEHIGEAQASIDEAIGDAQISILIGRTFMWNRGYGTAATLGLLEYIFDDLELYRAWADVPEFNAGALAMFEHIGFRHEGTLRSSRPHQGARFNSVIMGMLVEEYRQLYPRGVNGQVVDCDGRHTV